MSAMGFRGTLSGRRAIWSILYGVRACGGQAPNRVEQELNVMRVPCGTPRPGDDLRIPVPPAGGSLAESLRFHPAVAPPCQGQDPGFYARSKPTGDLPCTGWTFCHRMDPGIGPRRNGHRKLNTGTGALTLCPNGGQIGIYGKAGTERGHRGIGWQERGRL